MAGRGVGRLTTVNPDRLSLVGVVVERAKYIEVKTYVIDGDCVRWEVAGSICRYRHAGI